MGSLIAVPVTAIIPSVDSSDKMTMISGRNIPEILRNIINKKTATVPMASPMNFRISCIMARLRKCVTTGEPAIYVRKSADS